LLRALLISSLVVVVVATAAFCGLRPVANALGASVGLM